MAECKISRLIDSSLNLVTVDMGSPGGDGTLVRYPFWKLTGKTANVWASSMSSATINLAYCTKMIITLRNTTNLAICGFVDNAGASIDGKYQKWSTSPDVFEIFEINITAETGVKYFKMQSYGVGSFIEVADIVLI